jgi:nuclear pore complex protein Nup98-Nup96
VFGQPATNPAPATTSVFGQPAPTTGTTTSAFGGTNALFGGNKFGTSALFIYFLSLSDERF